MTAETGAQWTDLIRYLNDFGLSPRTMQSYSSFSVGGTLAYSLSLRPLLYPSNCCTVPSFDPIQLIPPLFLPSSR